MVQIFPKSFPGSDFWGDWEILKKSWKRRVEIESKGGVLLLTTEPLWKEVKKWYFCQSYGSRWPRNSPIEGFRVGPCVALLAEDVSGPIHSR